MIQDNQELEATLERIERFQKQVEKLQEVETNPRNYELSAGGFLAEIDRMNLEVQHYLTSNIFMYVSQLKRYTESEHSDLHGSTGRSVTSSTSLKTGAQESAEKDVLLKSTTYEVAVYDTILDDEITGVMKDLPNQFRVVEPAEKLAMTWSA